MDKEFSPDLMTLVDEDGKEQSFEIMDSVEYENSLYYALMPVYENKEDIIMDSGEYYILEAIEENGEEQLAEVMDEKLRRTLSNIFETRFNDIFFED